MPEEVCEHCNGEGRIEIDINHARVTGVEKQAFYKVCYTPGVHQKMPDMGDWFICDGSHVAPCPYCQTADEQSEAEVKVYKEIYCPVGNCKLLIVDDKKIIGCKHYPADVIRSYARNTINYRQGNE